MFKKRFFELTTTELYQILRLRAKVFVVEQGQAYLDLDNYDYESLHFFIKENDEVVSYLRILPTTYYKDALAIGRVVSDPLVRHKGYMRLLLNEAIKHLKEHFPNQTLIIGAQEYLLDYYASFGLVKYGSRYYEDNLPHFKMKMRL
ncbi:MAG: GNAT family N-acetyltransferase [Acholeplasmataceae bacterium]